MNFCKNWMKDQGYPSDLDDDDDIYDDDFQYKAIETVIIRMSEKR